MNATAKKPTLVIRRSTQARDPGNWVPLHNQFRNQGISAVHIWENGVFHLPEDGELIMLKGGQQFVYQGKSLRQRDGAVFGGIDEAEPFACIVASATFQAAYKGEVHFFDALKPQAVKVAEQRGYQVKRQGDYFLIRLAGSWDSLLSTPPKGFSFGHFGRQQPTPFSGPVKNSNHSVEGMAIVAQVFGAQACVFTGTVSARDHAPVNLKDEPHAMVRAVIATPAFET